MASIFKRIFSFKTFFFFFKLRGLLRVACLHMGLMWAIYFFVFGK